MLHSAPVVANTINDEQLNKGIKAYIALCCPEVPKGNIFLGNQNRVSLPPNTNEYIVFTTLGHIEHGTPVVRYETTSEAVTPYVFQLEEVLIQVDCYSDDATKARHRAENIKAIARTVLGTDFFDQYGFTSLYGESVRNTTLTVDAEQYVQRYTTTLHINYTHKIKLSVESFNAIDVDVIPVDGRFPPNKK